MGREDRNPRRHAAPPEEAIAQLREDLLKVDAPQLKAMCENPAEVLQGLAKAFRDYDSGAEPAWRVRT